jgi:hypothetical protein
MCSQEVRNSVMPAKAGIQGYTKADRGWKAAPTIEPTPKILRVVVIILFRMYRNS